MLDALDAAAARRWCALALELAVAYEQEVDELNVFPVPDGDTGTNVVLTLRAGAATLAERDKTDAPTSAAGPADVLGPFARGAVTGARGNSGVILGQLLRGLADALEVTRAADGADLARALQIATDQAYSAVANPVEGTILSVARAAARAARGAGAELEPVVRAAAEAATEALARTPDQLPVLARTGVVDAGGRSLVVLLEALLAVVSGAAAQPAPLPPVTRPSDALLAARESGSPEFGYEVQYLLDTDPAGAQRLRAELAQLGDSVVVVGTGDGLWNVHVHVNDAGAAVEAGVGVGRPHRITVTRFTDDWSDDRGEVPAHPSAPRRRVVALCPGPGLAALFRAEGATVVATDGAADPTADDVLTAIRAAGGREVVVLPNAERASAAVDAAARTARDEGRAVAVLPTRSPVQGLAALAVRDPARRFSDEVIAMAEAAGATRWAELMVAARDAFTSAGTCRAGDVLGLVDGEVVLIGAGILEVARDLLDRLLGSGGELVTLVLGTDAPARLGGQLEEHVRRVWPMVEVACYDGGQPDRPLLVGVE